MELEGGEGGEGGMSQRVAVDSRGLNMCELYLTRSKADWQRGD
jgi:hypothetical protein